MQDIKKDNYRNKSVLSGFNRSVNKSGINVISGQTQSKNPLQKLKDKYSNNYSANPPKTSASNKTIIKSKPPKLSITSGPSLSPQINKKNWTQNDSTVEINKRDYLSNSSQNNSNNHNSSNLIQPESLSTHKLSQKKITPTLIDVPDYTDPELGASTFYTPENTRQNYKEPIITSEKLYAGSMQEPISKDYYVTPPESNITKIFQRSSSRDMQKAKQKLENELNRNPRVKLKTKKQSFNFSQDFPSDKIYNEDYSLNNDRSSVLTNQNTSKTELPDNSGEKILNNSPQPSSKQSFGEKSNHTHLSPNSSLNEDYYNQPNNYSESSWEEQNSTRYSNPNIRPPEIVPEKSFLFKKNPNPYNFKRTEPFPNNSRPVKSKRKNVLKKAFYSFSLIMLPILLVGGISYYFLNNSEVSTPGNSNNLAVAGQQEKVEEKTVNKTKEDLKKEYIQWSTEIFGKEVSTEEDSDNDGLNNYEEFLLQTNPQQVSTCNNGISDIQNFLNLTNPSTCEPFSLDEETELKKYNQLIQKTAIEFEVLNLISTQNEAGETVYYVEKSNSPVLEIFGVNNYQAIDSLSVNSSFSEKQLDYLNLIKKIDAYITKTRSYDSYNKEYTSPVHPAVYLETSLKYEIPLKYLLSLAQLDSQFGTTRFTNSGTETNTHLSRNVFSIGLENSNHQIIFEDWRDSLAAMGNWYKFYGEKGIEDCQKWELYRPDENFCNIVNQNSKEIEEFMGE